MVLEKLKTCEDPLVLEKHRFDIGNDRVKYFTIEKYGIDNLVLYGMKIVGSIMDDYRTLINDENFLIDDPDEERLYFEVINDLIRYIIVPLSNHVKKGMMISEIIIDEYCNSIAFFIAPNAFAIDKCYPEGKICANVDCSRKKWTKFQEIHLLNSDYRYLFDNIKRYYQYLADKMLSNVEHSIPKKEKELK